MKKLLLFFLTIIFFFNSLCECKDNGKVTIDNLLEFINNVYTDFTRLSQLEHAAAIFVLADTIKTIDYPVGFNKYLKKYCINNYDSDYQHYLTGCIKDIRVDILFISINSVSHNKNEKLLISCGGENLTICSVKNKLFNMSDDDHEIYKIILNKIENYGDAVCFLKLYMLFNHGFDLFNDGPISEKNCSNSINSFFFNLKNHFLSLIEQAITSSNENPYKNFKILKVIDNKSFYIIEYELLRELYDDHDYLGKEKLYRRIKLNKDVSFRILRSKKRFTKVNHD